MAGNHPSNGSKFLGSVFGKIGMSLYVMFVSGWCLLIGMLPFEAAVLLLPDWHYYPTTLIALALSAPGIAALFAVFRDQPALSSRVQQIRVRALDDGYIPPEWIAASYVKPSEGESSIFRPYFRAYKRLFKRSLLQGLAFAFVIFTLVYDAQIFSQTKMGVAMVPALLIFAVFMIDAMLVALVLVVEYPKAKWWSLVKNGVLLSVRRIYMLLLVGLIVFGYGWAAGKKPLLVILLLTGFLAYVVWSSVRWQADRLFVLMAQESNDERVMDMYTSAGKDDGRAAGWTTTKEYHQ